MTINSSQEYRNTRTLIPVTRDQIEVPNLVSVFDLWDQLRDDRLAPSWSDIDMMAFPPSQIPKCVVVNCFTNPIGFVFRFWGTKNTELFKQDLTGKNVLDIEPLEVAEKIFEQYCVALKEKSPALFVNHVKSATGLTTIETILRLPLSSDGINVNHFISVFDFGKHFDAFQKYLEDDKN